LPPTDGRAPEGGDRGRDAPVPEPGSGHDARDAGPEARGTGAAPGAHGRGAPAAHQGPTVATSSARSPSRVAHCVTPNARVSRPVMARAPRSETGTRIGVRSPRWTGFIHISRATLA